MGKLSKNIEQENKINQLEQINHRQDRIIYFLREEIKGCHHRISSQEEEISRLRSRMFWGNIGWIAFAVNIVFCLAYYFSK